MTDLNCPENVVPRCEWQSLLRFMVPLFGSSGDLAQYSRPPDNLILSELARAAELYAESTENVRAVAYADAQCGVREVLFNVPDGRRVQRIIQVEVDGVEVIGHSYEEGDNFVTLGTAPDKDSPRGVKIRYAYSETADLTCSAPGWMCSNPHHREAVMALAAANLFGMPKQDWYEPRQQQFLMAQYSTYSTKARAKEAQKRRGGKRKRMSPLIGKMFLNPME